MSDSSSSDGEDTWIRWFCGLPGHEMFCEVERGYIEDGFNLYGLRHWVPSINDSLDIILDRVGHHGTSDELLEASYALYGLIHARYVLTSSGLEAMYAKYTLQEFGNCPHFACRRQPVVPVGVRDEPNQETVKLYCPKCQDVYVHPSHLAQRVDGAYFGTTFPHLFFMTYGSIIPDPPEQKFVPRVFGFRVHASAANGAFARDNGGQREQQLQDRRKLRGVTCADTCSSKSRISNPGGAAAKAAAGNAVEGDEDGGESRCRTKSGRAGEPAQDEEKGEGGTGRNADSATARRDPNKPERAIENGHRKSSSRGADGKEDNRTGYTSLPTKGPDNVLSSGNNESQSKDGRRLTSVQEGKSAKEAKCPSVTANGATTSTPGISSQKGSKEGGKKRSASRDPHVSDGEEPGGTSARSRGKASRSRDHGATVASLSSETARRTRSGTSGP